MPYDCTKNKTSVCWSINPMINQWESYFEYPGTMI